MKYQLRTSFHAEREIDQLLVWLSARSIKGAASWNQALQAAFHNIQQAPEAYSLAPENDAFPVEVREIWFKTRRGRKFRLLYTVVENEVRVLHVRGAGQDLVEP